MARLISAIIPIFFMAVCQTAEAAEIVLQPDQQKELSITIYNNDLALVRDIRTVQLPKGSVALAFAGISGQIRPETALFQADGINILEQNFEFDLLSPDSLLKKYVGRDVEIIKVNPATGKESIVPARVLSTNSGVVLKIGNRIETTIPGRISFPDLPQNLRTEPTLCLLAYSNTSGYREMKLTYLTSGLKWKADYIAQLNSEENALDLKGWVTLENRSGAAYRDARLQLVAGEVNRVSRPKTRTMRYKSLAVAPDSMENMTQESLMDYHLYTLGRPTTIKNRQTKQVSLLKASSVPCKKEYLISGGSGFYTSRMGGNGAVKLKAGIFLCFSNTKENNLGMALPAGVMRVYKADTTGTLQFVGEDRVDHTPEKEDIRLKLGNAFDITAWRKQTDFRKLAGSAPYNYIYETSIRITVKNAKEKDVTVKVQEHIPGDWIMLKESNPHKKVSARLAEWELNVPAKGETVLEYRVQVRL